MRVFLRELMLHCKTEQEHLKFADFNYFHGQMGAGKSTIARLIDYCLGGDLAYTPALQSKFVAVTLALDVGLHAVTLTRNRDESSIRASWSQDTEVLDILVPARQANGEVLPGTGIETLSDLLFYWSDIAPPMVRRNKARDDSQLVRLSFRDLLWYSYLDQDSMDNSFFRLDDSNYALRAKSLDVLRLIVGFHQQRISELQIELENVRTERQQLEAAVQALEAALAEEHLATARAIEAAIQTAREKQDTLRREIQEIRSKARPLETHAVEDLRSVCRQLDAELADIAVSQRDITNAIASDRAHRNSLLGLSLRQRRAQSAKEALSGLEFANCPQCYQALPSHPVENCPVCGQLHRATTTSPIDDAALEADVHARVDELDAKVQLQEAALRRLATEERELREEKSIRDEELARATADYDSIYLSQVIEKEKRIARLGQRIVNLRQRLVMAKRAIEIKEKAAALFGREGAIRSQIEEARNAAERDTSKIDRLKELFLDCLLRARMPGFYADDVVEMKTPWFLPQVIGINSGDLAITSYETLGSGGKKTLFKCCFALAVHRLAREQKATLPTLLILDSPMKNISERENRDQFVGFNHMLYELAENELAGTQFIVIDKEYEPPEADVSLTFFERYMNPDDDENPPLLRGYRGK
jgi:hypothetical protein